MLTGQSTSTELEPFVNFLRAHAAVVRELSSELVAAHGLTINDYEALLRLSRADGRDDPDRGLRGLLDLLEILPARIVRGGVLQQQFGEAENDREMVLQRVLELARVRHVGEVTSSYRPACPYGYQALSDR